MSVCLTESYTRQTMKSFISILRLWSVSYYAQGTRKPMHKAKLIMLMVALSLVLIYKVSFNFFVYLSCLSLLYKNNHIMKHC